MCTATIAARIAYQIPHVQVLSPENQAGVEDLSDTTALHALLRRVEDADLEKPRGKHYTQALAASVLIRQAVINLLHFGVYPLQKLLALICIMFQSFCTVCMPLLFHQPHPLLAIVYTPHRSRIHPS